MRNDHSPSISELVAAAGAGDQRSWEEIMSRYGRMVWSVVATFRLQDADAADAVQNTWLRALEQVRSVRDPERFGGWLKTTARRECLALPALSPREQPSDTVADLVVDTTPGPEAAVLRAETRREVRAAVDRLPSRRRKLVDVLFSDEPHAYGVVSRMVDMPVGSIGPTRARVLDSLRGPLEQAGLGTLPRQRSGSSTRMSCVRDLTPSLR